MIRFFISGRPVDPRNIKNALMRAVLEGVREQITEKVGAISRC